MSVGGGGLIDGSSRGVVALRLGGDFTVAPCDDETVGCTGDNRVGPFVEVETGSFSTVSALFGIELFRGALPRALRMFYYTGEGTLALRVGGGWTWRAEPPGRESAPVASATLTYGYRAPFSLRDYAGEQVDVQAREPAMRYMLGARLYVNAQLDLVRHPVWQLTGGIEVEPVGALRYLTGVGY